MEGNILKDYILEVDGQLYTMTGCEVGQETISCIVSDVGVSIDLIFLFILLFFAAGVVIGIMIGDTAK